MFKTNDSKMLLRIDFYVSTSGLLFSIVIKQLFETDKVSQWEKEFWKVFFTRIETLSNLKI